MTSMRLSDSQLVILSTACRRDDGAVFPILASLKGGAVGNVCKSLLKRGLIEEIQATDLNTVWRHDETLGSLTLRVTAAAKQALGVTDEEDDPPPAGGVAKAQKQSRTKATAVDAVSPAKGAVAATRRRKGKRASKEPLSAKKAATAPDKAEAGKVRAGTKQALLIGMLRRKEGATIAEVVGATGWLQHTVRGAMAGAIKKRLGFAIDSEKVDGRGRVYRIVG